jgi:glycosyltransferase involved in cell wall biosynthesis
MIERIVVINDDTTDSGGAAVIALSSVKMFCERGIRVTVLTGDDGGNPKLAEWGAEVLGFGGKHILEGGRAAAAFRGLYSAGAQRFIEQWIAEHDTPGTIYHLHNWHKVLSPSIFASLRKVSTRLVISAHDYFLVCPNGGYFHYQDERLCDLKPMSGSCCLSSCDKRNYRHKLWRMARHIVRSGLFNLSHTRSTIMAVHEGMIPHLERGGVRSDSIKVVRNPAVPWRETRVTAERNKDVFFVGRIERDKGIDVLARAVRKAGVSAKIIGDGVLRESLQHQYPEIEFLGYRTKREIAELVASARILVVPTRWRETFGLVAVEGLMSGIPVIASTSAPIAEEIVRLGLGMACPAADPTLLAQQIADLTADDDIVANISRRAFEEGRRLAPTPEEWCDALLALYESKCAEARSGAPH